MFKMGLESEDSAYKLGLLDKIAEEELGFYRECPFDKRLQKELAKAWMVGKYGTDTYMQVKDQKNLKYSRI